MSLDGSNHRHGAGLDDRASRNRRRDSQALYAANLGSDWIPRTGSGDDWHSWRMAMGTRGGHHIACWMEFVVAVMHPPRGPNWFVSALALPGALYVAGAL